MARRERRSKSAPNHKFLYHPAITTGVRPPLPAPMINLHRPSPRGIMISIGKGHYLDNSSTLLGSGVSALPLGEIHRCALFLFFINNCRRSCLSSKLSQTTAFPNTGTSGQATSKQYTNGALSKGAQLHRQWDPLTVCSKSWGSISTRYPTSRWDSM